MKTRDFAETLRNKARSGAPSRRSPNSWRHIRWIGVLLALVGIALSVRALAAVPSSRYLARVLVASQDLGAGQKLSRVDLASIQISSNVNVVGEIAATDASAVVGMVLTTDVPKGSMISAGELASPARGTLDREISFAIPASRALGGNLAPGDRIDILATTGTGSGAITTVLGRSLLVTGVLAPASGLGSPSDPSITITIASPDSMTALAIANGAASATLWIDLANAVSAPNDSGTYQVSFSG